MMPIKTSWLTHDIGWNERAGRYVDTTTGRFVRHAAVRDQLEAVIERSQSDMAGLSQRLRSGEISLSEWQLGMERNIKNIHVASAAAARGGWAQMNPSDWGWVGRECRRQYEYLRRFAGQVADGKQPLNGRFLRRAQMYAQAGRGTFEEMRRRYMRLYKGAAEERRVLGMAEHCQSSGNLPGCVEQAEIGWAVVGSKKLVPIGGCTCLVACKCRYEFRDAAGKQIGA